MGVWEPFSKRQEKADGAGQPTVYTYDTLPIDFRNQVIHIWIDTIGRCVPRSPEPWGMRYEEPPSDTMWQHIFRTFVRELGVFSLGKPHQTPDTQCITYFQSCPTKYAVDLMELVFKRIDMVVRRWSLYDKQEARVRQDSDSAIQELNYRFKDHGIGYQFEHGQLMRIDSQFVHTEVVEPALALLQGEQFNGASDEFLRAHEHYRKGRPKEAIAEALKAFESTMKTICDLKGWTYANATAVPLIGIIIKNGLVPAEMESHFGALRSAMESGLPTIRNKQGGHGQGKDVKEVPDYLAAYALHLCAANIVFLVQAYKATLR